MKILAIDPGYGRIGLAVLLKEGGRIDPLFSECFETGKEMAFEERLERVGSRVRDVIQIHQPVCVAIERLFFSKNKKNCVADSGGAWCVYLRREGSWFGGG